ncbi:uncharacterized protein LOC141647556 [Silene latifolia]|uniref:uncharacterized protein LOC141647556 n=1 Tax=Silene latifolia TaxID=37657 RepID=UPI003D77558F
MGDLRETNGVVLEEKLPCIGQEVWEVAEAATGEIIRRVQPTVVSEERRKDVIEYVHWLLKGYLGCEVFPFGSVPLKTYLPDGDIDLTAFCGFNFEESFANEVYSVLAAEDRNPAAKFVVKDVQYICAEVKLVKCLVQNIVVDISFNQIGGLCTLCFLEEIDRLIGKDHLFKRSIILIKAWCYYESRILGAHHGLISTYALETLVLYIFHLFHSSLNGPLAVLHKFLDYFSKFDWELLCVSLSGPIHVDSLPEVVAEKPETNVSQLLLSDDFMRECVRKFSVPSRGGEANYKTFMMKHLNIVDPLKENNNLGRSVSKGNFFRIRSAFSYGARKLGQILLQPRENIAEEVRKFFTNTLDRHGTGQRPDVQEHLQLSTCNGFIPDLYQNQIHEENSDHFNTQSRENRVTSDDTEHAIMSDSKELGTNFKGTMVEHKNDVKKSNCLSRDANELSSYDTRDSKIMEKDNESCPSIGGDEKLPSCDLLHAPHIYFSRHKENGKMENGYLDEEQHKSSSLTQPDLHSVYENGSLVGTAIHDTVELPPDLAGNVDCHLDNLQYGRWWYDQGLAMGIHQPSIFQPNVSWNTINQSLQLGQEVASQMNVNGMIPRHAFFSSNPPATQLVDESPKARGLGTFIPVMNYHSYIDRTSPKERYQGQFKYPRVNGRGPSPLERIPVQGPFRHAFGRPKFHGFHDTFPRGKIFKETNGFIQAPDKVFEYDRPLDIPPEAVMQETETCKSPESDPSSGSDDAPPVVGVNDIRLSVQSFRLKDDEDFPPLCT